MTYPKKLMEECVECVECRDYQDIKGLLEKGQHPRGWMGSRGNGKVAKVVVVGKNPGHALNGAMDMSKNQKWKNMTSKQKNQYIMKSSTKTFRDRTRKDKESTIFHKKIGDYLLRFFELTNVNYVNKKNLHFFIWKTNLFKCSTEKETGAYIPKPLRKKCAEKFLIEELKFFKPKVIFAFGKPAFNFLRKTDDWKTKAVYFKHPSVGGWKEGNKELEKALKRATKIYNR